jgi:hypothetical protein
LPQKSAAATKHLQEKTAGRNFLPAVFDFEKLNG